MFELRGLLSLVDAIGRGAGTRIYKAPETSYTLADSWDEGNHIIGTAAPGKPLLAHQIKNDFLSDVLGLDKD